MPRYFQILLAIALSSFLLGCSAAKSEEASNTPETSPTPTPSPTPSPTPDVNFKKVGAGARKSFAITTSGVPKSWGSNYEGSNDVYGQIGQGLMTNTDVTSPQSMTDPGETYVSIVAGEILGCGLTSSYKIKCWGALIGDGTGNVKYSPTLIDDGGTSTYVDVATGSYHGCGVTVEGVMKCWGDGWDGKLGNADATNATQDSPVVANPGTTYRRVAAGRNHTCGITSSNVLQCWGTNSNGQIGDTTTTGPRLTAVTVDPGVSYSEIAAGEDTTCGITTAGILKCWGYNNLGQVGDNSIINRPTPTVIDSGVSYSKVSVGGSSNFHTCAITTSGILKCWGDNSQGQLGIGNTTQSLLPVVVESGTAYREVAAGTDHTCAIAISGDLKCWGNNTDGELGLGNTTPDDSPALVQSGY